MATSSRDKVVKIDNVSPHHGVHFGENTVYGPDDHKLIQSAPGYLESGGMYSQSLNVYFMFTSELLN